MSTNFLAILITPSFEAWVESRLDEYLAHFANSAKNATHIMYRQDNLAHFARFYSATKTLQKPLILNLPFSDIAHITDILSNYPHIKGIHLKANLLSLLTPLRALDSSLIIGYSAHSVAEVESAISQGATYATLSPIFKTPNKSAPLGLDIFSQLEVPLRAKTIALGGIEAKHIDMLKDLGLLGFAGIRCFEA